jgi:hypothetical protein
VASEEDAALLRKLLERHEVGLVPYLWTWEEERLWSEYPSLVVPGRRLFRVYPKGTQYDPIYVQVESTGHYSIGSAYAWTQFTASGHFIDAGGTAYWEDEDGG